MDEIPRPNPEPPAHGPEPSENEVSRIGKRRRRRRHRRRKQHAGGPPSFEEAADQSLAAQDGAEAAPSWPGGDERPFLGAVLDDDGEIRYRTKTRQRTGAKYLLREVFD